MPTPGFQAGVVRGREVVLAKGYEIDLARAVAAQLGRPGVRFVNEARFSDLFASGAKDWEVGIGQITVTDKRRRGDRLLAALLRGRPGRAAADRVRAAGRARSPRWPRCACAR